MAVFDPLQTSAATLDVMAATQASAPEIAARQRARLTRLIDAATRNSPLYRERLQGLPADAPLSALPVFTRDALMARFDDWVCDPRLTLAGLRQFTADPQRIAEPYLGSYMVWESSGTGGAPGIFVQDAAAMAVYDALEAQRRSAVRPLQRWLDPFFFSERMAFVGATSGHFASYVSVQRLRRLNPWLAQCMQSFSIQQAVASLVDELNRFAPTIIATYPTVAALLACEAERGRLQFRPKEVWTGGENLGDGVRQRVERGLDCTVRNSYGASEFLSMGWECGHGQLHANVDWLILEPVDAHYRPVVRGRASGTTLLTNLANTVQPLIRYDLGDRITVGVEPCTCGSASPVIHVAGRHDDPLRLRDPQGRQVTLLPLALTTALEEQAGVFDFQVCQLDRQTLALSLPECVDAAIRAHCHGVLRAFVASHGMTTVRIVDRPGLRRGRSGKMKRVLAA